MVANSIRFPLHNSIRKILDDPNSRPALPGLDEGSIVGDDNFGKADRYDTGKWSDIALNNKNVVVEVHNTTDSKSLYYRVGKVDGRKINWGESHYYDKGVEPSVAITDDGLVVEVHKSQGAKNTLWYRVGNVEGNEIKWRNDDTSAEYDSGVHPSVAITNSGLVVEVHQSQSHDTLWYGVGKVEGNEIKWENNGESIEYEKGIHPSVAITNSGLVVEVHQSPNPSGAPFDDAPPPNTLWYRVGRVKSNGIIWVEGDRSKSTQYDNGVHPSVAITNDGLVVEVHQSQSHNTLWYRGTGQVNNNTIDGWDDKKNSQNFGDGTTPRVACNGQLAVETHSGADNQLLSSVLTLPAFRGKWTVLEGDNSYCYCACNSATDSKDRHASDHTMNIKEGAPYFYAVLTKDDDSIDFPTGAILTIEAPDGTKYDRDIQEENQLVIMSGSSVRCLIVKNPQSGDWKMTMTVPKGVGFHCECNTVPSKDVYDTMTKTLNSLKAKKPLQPRAVPVAVIYIGIAAIVGLISVVFGADSAAPAHEVSLDLGVAGTGNPSLELTDPLFEDARSIGVNGTAQRLDEIARQNTRTVVRFTTWNMQGGRNLPYLNQVVQQPPTQFNDNLIQILALQETGNLTNSTNFVNDGPFIDETTGVTLGNILNRQMNGNFMEFVYAENNWAQGGMALASNIHRENQGILPAVNVASFIPRNSRNLPWATVNIPSSNQNTSLTIYTIHAPPVFGNVTVAHVRQWVTSQIAQITQREGNNRWILLGDFNLTPEQLGNVPGVHVIHGNRATHQSGDILDYAVTNAQGLITPAPPDNVPSASDHYPATFEWHLNTADD